MLEQIWFNFKQNGYCGSVSTLDKTGIHLKSDLGYDDQHIHEAIHQMDEEYTYVKVIHEGYKGAQDILEVSLGNDLQANKDALDNAILEGLAHLHIFRETQTGAVVQFGYKLDEA